MKRGALARHCPRRPGQFGSTRAPGSIALRTCCCRGRGGPLGARPLAGPNAAPSASEVWRLERLATEDRRLGGPQRPQENPSAASHSSNASMDWRFFPSASGELARTLRPSPVSFHNLGRLLVIDLTQHLERRRPAQARLPSTARISRLDHAADRREKARPAARRSSFLPLVPPLELAALYAESSLV